MLKPKPIKKKKKPTREQRNCQGKMFAISNNLIFIWFIILVSLYKILNNKSENDESFNSKSRCFKTKKKTNKHENDESYEDCLRSHTHYFNNPLMLGHILKTRMVKLGHDENG